VNILDRYFLKQFVKPFGACLVSFLLCMLVHDLFDNINDFIEAHTPLEKILTYYVILIPNWLVLIMPITLLLSLLYVLSSMSKNGELTAMRASGLDFFRLMMPYFIIGICVSMQMLSLKIAWAPNSSHQAKTFFEENTGRKKEEVRDKANDVAYYDIAGNRFWNVKTLDPSRNEATGIEIIQRDENRNPIKRISARIGYYQQQHWRFEDVIIFDYTLPVTARNSIKEELLEAHDFKEAPQQFIVEQKKTKRMTTREILWSLNHSHNLSPKQYADYSTEFHTRISFPLANFVVFLIGIPFGVVRQRHSTFIAISNALLLFFAYTFFSESLVLLGQSGRLPSWLAAWLPNILFGAIGMLLIRKIR
jgi:lipopolysaccharide export system permease protein